MRRAESRRISPSCPSIRSALALEIPQAFINDFGSKLGKLSRLFALDRKQPSDAGKSQGQRDRKYRGD
jgi:hypothetical protein